ncbi:MAG: competence type IV pilus major pilin ComGC [Alkalibacterium sp.]|nr:competence type IV pilus major pilin ComGC [Alkalibacterium sp.]
MKLLKAWIKREQGFTLIEMSLVLFIISALLLLFVPNLAGRQADASKTGDEAIVAVLQSQADMYTMDKGTAPASLTELHTEKYITLKQFNETNEKYEISEGKVTEKPEAPDTGGS